MSTQTHPVSRARLTPEPTTAAEGRTAGRAIVGSVVAGAVVALLLALVVFAGGTEATITGALLLGFGFGWALMATLTVRRTRQPQRWAFVPAVAMGATGAALMVLTPGNETMAALTWVWPPLLLALTGWMFLRVRRSVTGRARWALVPVLAVLGAGLARRCLRRPRGRRRPGLPRPGQAVRRRRPPAPPGLPRPRLPHRRAVQRPRRDLGKLGPDHRSRRGDHPGLRLRPRRAGLERRGRQPAGRRRVGRGPAHAPRRGRRARPLRAGRALHRRHLRDDVRRPLPRAGRRPGAAGQLEPRAVHPDARLPEAVPP